jgi:hypothetical protein
MALRYRRRNRIEPPVEAVMVGTGGVFDAA